MATYLNKTLGTPTNNKIYTFSCWVKRAKLGQYSVMLNAGSSRDCLRFRGDNDRLHFFTGEATTGGLATNRVFRDTSGYYHIVLAVDTTQATDTNRVKLYVNGVQETSFADTNYPAQNYTNVINSAVEHRIGKASNAYEEYFLGAMSYVIFVDGQQLAPTVFGETDATSGEWVIKTSPSVTYGDNGFFILKNGNSVTDQSGEGNNWAVAAGTLTDLKDCPDDVFATMNPLVTGTDMTLINGNNTQQRTSASWDYSVSTLGANKGKYYFEGKIGGTGHWILGATDDHAEIGQNELGNGSGDAGWRDTGDVKVANSSVSYSPSVTYTSSDVVCVAMDLDNHKIYFRKNGDAWINSGDPTSGATGTGAFNLASTTKTYFFAVCSYITSGTGTWDINFGNGYFGTSAISSEGTNASNIGKFEYDVPTGYSALSAKGLNK